MEQFKPTYLYIIKGINEFYYCGITKNISRRIIQHNLGMSNSTKNNRPFVIIYLKTYTNSLQARITEKKIKSQGVFKWYLKNIKFKHEN
jgi:putative endonuclease